MKQRLSILAYGPDGLASFATSSESNLLDLHFFDMFDTEFGSYSLRYYAPFRLFVVNWMYARCTTKYMQLNELERHLICVPDLTKKIFDVYIMTTLCI